MRSPNDTNVLVEALGIGYRDSRHWLVENVDLSIRRGEIVTLIGPNGSGKSTTARLITGVLKPTTGIVQRQPGLVVGYVPQAVVIDQSLPLTVNRLMSLTSNPTQQDIDAALDTMQISHLAKQPVQDISGGEFQRVLIARALVRKPDLLILDEPVQGVDINAEIAIYQLIRDIRDANRCGILMISHDLHVVMAETDSVVCLNGHICCRGTPQSVVNNPEYLKIFGSRAAEALAIYRHQHDHTHLPDGRIQHLDGTITVGHSDGQPCSDSHTAEEMPVPMKSQGGHHDG